MPLRASSRFPKSRMDKGFAGDAPIRVRQPSTGADTFLIARAPRCATHALHALHSRQRTHAPLCDQASAMLASRFARHRRTHHPRVMRARNGLHRRNSAKASRGHQSVAIEPSRDAREASRQHFGRRFDQAIGMRVRSARLPSDPDRARRASRVRALPLATLRATRLALPAARRTSA